MGLRTVHLNLSPCPSSHKFGGGLLWLVQLVSLHIHIFVSNIRANSPENKELTIRRNDGETPGRKIPSSGEHRGPEFFRQQYDNPSPRPA